MLIPLASAGSADLLMGTLSCSPGIAHLRTASGSISVDSLDGRARVDSQASDPAARVNLHAQDNLELLSVHAKCGASLGLAPALARKAVCSTDPSSLAKALPDEVLVEDREQSMALKACQSGDAIPQDPGADALGLVHERRDRPSIFISCQGTFTAFIESWIDSLARRRQQTS